MNKKSFIKILQQPDNLTDTELNFVREINIEYPFFQASKVIELNLDFSKKLFISVLQIFIL